MLSTLSRYAVLGGLSLYKGLSLPFWPFRRWPILILVVPNVCIVFGLVVLAVNGGIAGAICLGFWVALCNIASAQQTNAFEIYHPHLKLLRKIKVYGWFKPTVYYRVAEFRKWRKIIEIDTNIALPDAEVVAAELIPSSRRLYVEFRDSCYLAELIGDLDR